MQSLSYKSFFDASPIVLKEIYSSGRRSNKTGETLYLRIAS